MARLIAPGVAQCVGRLAPIATSEREEAPLAFLLLLFLSHEHFHRALLGQPFNFRPSRPITVVGGSGNILI